MTIYHEFTGEVIADPDLSAGYLYDGTVVTGQRTVKMEGESGLRVMEDVTEPCMVYHPYTGNENVPNSSTGTGDAATWAELAAAYNEGVLSLGQ